MALLGEPPLLGGVAIFDRSWYGRVLVERVEGIVPEEAWQRAYDEIVSFERTLVAEGMVLVKFWLHISEDDGDSEDRPHHPYTLDWMAQVMGDFAMEVGGRRPLAAV